MLRFPQLYNINISINGDNQALEAQGKMLKATSIPSGPGNRQFTERFRILEVHTDAGEVNGKTAAGITARRECAVCT